MKENFVKLSTIDLPASSAPPSPPKKDGNEFIETLRILEDLRNLEIRILALEETMVFLKSGRLILRKNDY